MADQTPSPAVGPFSPASGRVRVEREIAGRTLSIETGHYARLSNGAVMLQYGQTVILSAIVRADPRPGLDFFPLQVEYRERRAAAGKFPGGFMKREGRPTNKEILTARLIDRPLRPLFPKGFQDDTQIHLNVLSFDGENDPDVLSGIAASACTHVSDLPFETPTAHVRVGRIDGELVLFPTIEQVDQSDFDLVVAGTKRFVNMIELGGNEVPEDEVADAIEFGHKAIAEIVDMLEELRQQAGRPKVGNVFESDGELRGRVRELASAKIREVKGRPGKEDRRNAMKLAKADVLGAVAPAPAADASFNAIMSHRDLAKKVSGLFGEIEEEVTRQMILDGVRPDGRGAEDIRPITCEIDVLPRVHGSAVFTRGETQSMCTVTLGTSSDEQLVDGLTDEYSQKFMLHYNFPNYSVGEVRPIRGLSRREVGHGALAERALVAVLPTVEQFPYTVRVISDILESNGSSSMASACCGCLSLMAAGVPIRTPVAGISVGLIQEGEGDQKKQLLLTDILGEEDHFGDMDFKVCGTREGITAIQLDIKIEGLDHAIIRKTLHRAKDARMKILDVMAQTLDAPRAEISENAPRLLTIRINPEKIGKLIGPGGKTIKKIQEETGARIDIDDDGTVYLSSADGDGAERARQIVEAMTGEVQIGRIYEGTVVSIKEFGAFVEIAPETDGLVHVSELSKNYVNRVDDYLKMGDVVKVKVLLIDDQGRIKLSRRAAFEELGIDDPEPVSTANGDRGGEYRGGGGGDRGPRRDGGGAGRDRGPRREGGERDRGPRRD